MYTSLLHFINLGDKLILTSYKSRIKFINSHPLYISRINRFYLNKVNNFITKSTINLRCRETQGIISREKIRLVFLFLVGVGLRITEVNFWDPNVRSPSFIFSREKISVEIELIQPRSSRARSDAIWNRITIKSSARISTRATCYSNIRVRNRG